MADSSNKRKADSEDGPADAKKRATGKKRWQTPREVQSRERNPKITIEAGDVGIFATCDMGREGKCATELKDMFEEYAERLYALGDQNGGAFDGDQGDIDVAADIANELREMQAAKRDSLFTNTRLDDKCVVFFKTRTPVEPVSLVHAICKDAASSNTKGCRFVRKLTPITLFGRATKEGLQQVTRKVLAPHFHDDASKGKKFAIRPNFRYHQVMKRMDVIKDIASVVGPDHSVDLQHYDLLILVEVYKNVLGMSVVGSDYDDLKRYNIAELHQPSSKVDSP